MLKCQPVQSPVLRRPWSIQKWRAPLPQCDHRPVVVQKRQELAVSPDAALIDRRIRHAALPPKPLPRVRASGLPLVDGFDQAAAFRAVVEDVGDRIPGAAPLLETGKFGCHEALL